MVEAVSPIPPQTAPEKGQLTLEPSHAAQIKGRQILAEVEGTPILEGNESFEDALYELERLNKEVNFIKLVEEMIDSFSEISDGAGEEFIDFWKGITDNQKNRKLNSALRVSLSDKKNRELVVDILRASMDKKYAQSRKNKSIETDPQQISEVRSRLISLGREICKNLMKGIFTVERYEKIIILIENLEKLLSIRAQDSPLKDVDLEKPMPELSEQDSDRVRRAMEAEKLSRAYTDLKEDDDHYESVEDFLDLDEERVLAHLISELNLNPDHFDPQGFAFNLILSYLLDNMKDALLGDPTQLSQPVLLESINKLIDPSFWKVEYVMDDETKEDERKPRGRFNIFRLRGVMKGETSPNEHMRLDFQAALYWLLDLVKDDELTKLLEERKSEELKNDIGNWLRYLTEEGSPGRVIDEASFKDIKERYIALKNKKNVTRPFLVLSRLLEQTEQDPAQSSGQTSQQPAAIRPTTLPESIS